MVTVAVPYLGPGNDRYLATDFCTYRRVIRFSAIRLSLPERIRD